MRPARNYVYVSLATKYANGLFDQIPVFAIAVPPGNATCRSANITRNFILPVFLRSLFGVRSFEVIYVRPHTREVVTEILGKSLSCFESMLRETRPINS